MGAQVSFADFAWAGFLAATRRLGDDVHGVVMARTGDPAPHLALLGAVKPWTERDDH